MPTGSKPAIASVQLQAEVSFHWTQNCRQRFVIGDNSKITTIEIGMKVFDTENKRECLLLHMGVVSLTGSERMQHESDRTLGTIREHVRNDGSDAVH